jgi:hypothetical protein
MQWVHRTDVGSPGARGGAAMAYDTDRHVTVLFGGDVSGSAADTWFNDTWEYDGTQWTQITIDGPVPPRRSNHAMCYNPVLYQVMMTGGENVGGYLGDSWVYTPTSPGHGIWTTGPGLPNGILGVPGRSGHTMVFDEELGEIVLIGGAVQISGNEYTRTEMMAYDGVNWEAYPRGDELQVLGFGYPNGQAGLARHMMAYDSDEQRWLLYQGWLGCDLPGTACDPSSDPTETPFGWGFASDGSFKNLIHGYSGITHARQQGAMVYDKTRKRFVVVGGFNAENPNLSYLNPQLEYVHTGDTNSPYAESFFLALGDPTLTSLLLTRHAMVYDSYRQVTIRFGGASGTSRFGDTYELVSVPPVFTQQPPTTQTVCAGTPVQFQVTMMATDSGYVSQAFQWFKNGQALAGANTNSLILNSTTTNDTGIYQCVVVDNCGNSVTSQNSVLTVNTQPAITSFDPTPLNRCPGDSVSFTVVGTATEPIAYQWYKDGSYVPGATGNILTLTNLQHQDTGKYYVVLSDDCGSVTSPQVPLQVGVTISQQPVSTPGATCQTALFSVTAQGVGTLHYQWRFDGTPIAGDSHFSGTNSGLLHISPLIYTHEGKYDVIITDDCGPLNAVTSTVAKLTLPTPPWVEVAMLPAAPEVFQSLGNWVSAYDERRSVFVMYGGYDFRGYPENNLWEYNGQTWTAIQDAYNGTVATNGQQLFGATNAPNPPSSYAMVYNPDDGLIYLLGEAGSTWPMAIWTWDGHTWRQPYYGPVDGGHISYRAVYDRARHKIFLIRNINGSSYGSELLIYDPASQTLTGPVVLQPPVDRGVYYAFWVYDEQRKLSFWYQNDGLTPPVSTWAFDGTNWTDLAGSSMVFPSIYDNFPAVVYDPVRHHNTSLGAGYFYQDNSGFYTATWAFPTGANDPALPGAGDWYQLLPDGPPRVPAGLGVSPTNAWSQVTLGFDRRRRAFIAPGYLNASPYAGGPAWSWKSYESRYADTVQFDVNPIAVPAQRGATVSLSVKAAGFGALSYQWRRNAINVRDGPAGASPGGGTLSGSTSNILTIAGLADSDQGSYDVVVANACGPATSQAVLLEYTGWCFFSGPGFTGGEFSIQLNSLPGLTLTIEVAPTLNGPWQKTTNVTISSSGTFQFTDPVPTGQNRFYRTAYPAY